MIFTDLDMKAFDPEREEWCSVKAVDVERNEICLSNGRVRFWKVLNETKIQIKTED